MALYVSAFDGMGSGEDSVGGQLQNLAGINTGSLNFAFTTFLQQEGVTDTQTDFVFTPQGANRRVDISTGLALVENNNWTVGSRATKFWGVFSDAVETVEFAANVSGLSRIDVVALKVDPNGSANDDGTGVVTIELLQGTPAASPVAPTIPDHHIGLFSALLPDGFTTVSSGDLTDLRQQAAWAGSAGLGDGYVEVSDTLNFGSADNTVRQYTMTITGADRTSTYREGMKFRCSQTTGGEKHFIIHKSEFSVNTTITMYGGTDFQLENEAITAPSLGTSMLPTGFPNRAGQWSTRAVLATTTSVAAPGVDTWVNPGSFSITKPAGSFRIGYEAAANFDGSSDSAIGVVVTLSTANNSESDNELTSRGVVTFATANGNDLIQMFSRNKGVHTVNSTQYFLNVKSFLASDSLGLRGADLDVASVIFVESAFT